MKKIILVFALILFITIPAFAFLYSIEIFSVDEVAKFNDKQLAEIYTEAKIEDKTSGEFIEAAGFSSAKDYEKRKKLLRFIIDLRREMSKRGIEPEPIEDWLQ